MVTRRDYETDAVAAARSVLLEIAHLLGEYRKHIVLIGGWVPELSIPESDQQHVGSLDLDLAIDHRTLPEHGYGSILNLLHQRGYTEGKQPFIFERRISQSGREITVQVDLLAGEYEGTGKGHRHQRVQNIHARKVRGCDLAFNHPH